MVAAFSQAFTKMARYEIGPTRMWDVADIALGHWNDNIKDKLKEKYGTSSNPLPTSPIMGDATDHSRNHVKINMTPNQFLAAAAPLTIDEANPHGDSYPPDFYDDEGKLKRLERGLYPRSSQPYLDEMANEMGKGRPFGMPNLYVHRQDGNWHVNSHEGRHRMKSLVDMGYGDVTIPVTASHHHFEDEESYRYGGSEALRDALHGGNLMSQSSGSPKVMQIDVTDPQNWEPGTIPIETGEPMEIAFQLLKTPLDFDSIEEVKPKKGATVTTADFLHPDPDIDEKLKLILYGGSQIRAYKPEDVGDDPYDAYDEVADAEYHAPVRFGWRQPFTTRRISVDEEHRRKGLASAMHDLMNHKQTLYPNRDQTEAARKMWAKRLGVERSRGNRWAGDLDGGMVLSDFPVIYDKDDVWKLLKMPYHGTDARSAEKILNRGTRAFKDKRKTFRRDPAQFWMTDSEKEARRHATRHAGRTGFAPTVLHITDEGVDSVPNNSWDNVLGRYTTHKHPHRIDPEHISIHEQGQEPDEPIQEVKWDNWDQMQAGIKDMDDVDEAMRLYDEWEQNRDIRDEQLRNYRSQLQDWWLP